MTLAKKPVYVALVVLVLIFFFLFTKKGVTFSGETMGTTYQVTVIESRFKTMNMSQNAIETRLQEINKSMSTYDSDSEISKFNQLKNSDPIAASHDFISVLNESTAIYKKTGGAWDGSVKPVLDLWGFTGKVLGNQIPTVTEVHQALANVGFDGVQVMGVDRIKKINPNIQIDLSSIAKGYAVDALGELLRARGFRNFFVQIGGEVLASGQKRKNHSWQVGINKPEKTASQNEIYGIVALKNQAMATSGDYRNYIEIDGESYSHIIDPRIGYPVRNNIVSVTVIASTCMVADGLATALMVMNKQAGLSLLNKESGIEGLILYRDRENQIKMMRSDNFPEIKTFL